MNLTGADATVDGYGVTAVRTAGARAFAVLG